MHGTTPWVPLSCVMIRWCRRVSWQLGWCVWQDHKVCVGRDARLSEQPSGHSNYAQAHIQLHNTCHSRAMCVLQGLSRAQTMRRHHLAKWCAHFCKMGVLEAWHQIDSVTSVKQAEQASHSKQLFHVSECAWCCHFRILSTPMNPFGASIATGVPGVRHMALH